MPYIGTSQATNFASTIRDNFTGDGSTTDFTLSRNATTVNDLEVFVGNVRQQPVSAYNVSGSTLSFTGTPANGEVIYVVHQGGALQTIRADSDFGSRNFQITGNINMTKDSAVLSMGADSDVLITHDPDDGLFIKSTATADNNPLVITLQTGETDIAADDKLGVINFQAPDEGTGTDAILVAAGIEAVSEGDFSASNNATKLSFLTGSSGAATEKMSISSGGNVDVTGNMTIGGNLDVTGTVSFSENNVTDVGIMSLDTLRGDADTNTSIVFSGSDVITIATGGTTAATFNASQILTLADDLIIKSDGTIGGANDTDLLTLGNAILTVAGEVSMTTLDIGGTNVTSTAAELNILDGVTSTTAELNLLDGGTSVGSSITLADADGFFVNDGGASKLIPASDIKTYIGSSTAADDLTIGDAAILLTTSSGNITIDAAANDSDIIFKGTDGGSDRVFMTIDGSAGGDLFLTGGLIDLKNDGSNVSQIKFYCESSNAHAQTLIGAPHAQSADNTLTLPDGADGVILSTTSTATVTNKTLTSPIINTGTFGTSILPTSADGTTLGSASKEFSDLFLADASTIQFGADQDVTLTHVADTGLLLNTTMVIQFRDAAINIGSPADGDLDINADDEIELNSTLIDINGNVEISGTAAITGIATFTDDIIIGDGKTIGSASDIDAITIASNGQVTLTQTLIGTALDISGNIDVDGTTNLDVVDIDGAVDMATTLQVDGAITSSAGMIITTADNTAQLTLTSTDGDSASGPRMELIRDSGSPANADNIGLIVWKADDAGGTSTEVIQMLGVVEDVTDGSEYGSLDIRTMVAGTSRSRIDLDITETVFNQDSVDVDFRVESDAQENMLVVNGGHNSVQINTNAELITGDAVLSVRGQIEIVTDAGTQCLEMQRQDAGLLQNFRKVGGSSVGNITISGTATAFNTSSDYRLKENVVTSWDATTRLKQLKPSRFNFIADADTTVDGFLAHEVSSVVPEAISGTKDEVDADGNPVHQSIDQSKLVPLLVKTLQEALAEIDTLKTKVQALEDA